jgi:hypothetical protein
MMGTGLANEESKSICLAAFNAIRASHLNSLDLAISVQRRFSGALKHRKAGISVDGRLRRDRGMPAWCLGDVVNCITTRRIGRRSRGFTDEAEEAGTPEQEVGPDI